HGAKFGDHQAGAVLDDGRSQRFHRVEVVVKGTLGHPGALDDRAPISSREPDLGEHFDRGVENLSPCRFRSNLPGHRLLPPEFRLFALSFRTLAIATILTWQRSLTGRGAGPYRSPAGGRPCDHVEPA